MKAHGSEQASEKQDAVAGLLRKGSEIVTMTLLLLLALSIGTGVGFASTIPITGIFGGVQGFPGSGVLQLTGPSLDVENWWTMSWGVGIVSAPAPGVLGEASGTFGSNGMDDLGYYSGRGTLDGQTGIVFASISFVTAPYVGPPFGVDTYTNVPMTFVGTLDAFEIVWLDDRPWPGPALWSANLKGSGDISIEQYSPYWGEVGEVYASLQGRATTTAPESSSLFLVFLTFIAIGALLVRQYRTSRG